MALPDTLPGTIEERIDVLIRERAAWVYRRDPFTRGLRSLLHFLLAYRKTLEIGDYVQELPAPEIMDVIADISAHNVTVEGFENIPESGAAIIVANHPTGIADGIILHAILRDRRPDLFFFANGDILRVLPQFYEVVAPVEWRVEKRTHGTNRETISYARRAFGEGRLGIMFPSGRIAKRRWFKLHERPWMASAAMMARKFDLPVIPVNIQARNSILFYLFDKLHPSLRDITLFHEMINKARQPFRLRVGDPIQGATLPSAGEDAIDKLYRTTMRLSGPDMQSVLTLPRPARAFGRKRVITS